MIAAIGFAVKVLMPPCRIPSPIVSLIAMRKRCSLREKYSRLKKKAMLIEGIRRAGGLTLDPASSPPSFRYTARVQAARLENKQNPGCCAFLTLPALSPVCASRVLLLTVP